MSERVTIVFAMVLLPSVATAYVDPGTGSVLLQMLLAGAVGVGVVVKLYWRKLRSRLGGREKPEDRTGR